MTFEHQYRIERDSLGEVRVPKDALYGAQTQRAVENFPISGIPMPRAFIRALGLIKGAAALTNSRLGRLDNDIAQAILTAAEEVGWGEHDEHFPVDIFQTGSGTSSNMNANEVIANLATKILGKTVHPNDHVNRSQSSNDVIPTAIRVSTTTQIMETLLPALKKLQATIEAKGLKLDGLIKTGRTHLMDAMPISFSQELSAWSTQIKLNIDRFNSLMPRLTALPQGGTAVGTGINAHPEFHVHFANELSTRTGILFTHADNFFEALSSQDTAVETSGQLKVTATSLMKIANDLRWMNSGPLTGLNEIVLPALQPGSSIMPGKVNPVIPESVTMVCAQVFGNDTTISIAGQSGNFQLNVMLPVIAYNLLQSINLLSSASDVLADKAIQDFEVNSAKLDERISHNPILVTALNEVIGYEQAAKIAKQAYKENKPIKQVALEMTSLSVEDIDLILDPKNLIGPKL